MLRLLTEYDEKEHMRRVKRDARMEGEEIGEIRGEIRGEIKGELRRSREVIYDFLSNLGEIPEDICKRIEAQEDMDILRQWYMAAPRAETFDAFRQKLEEVGKR